MEIVALALLILGYLGYGVYVARAAHRRPAIPAPPWTADNTPYRLEAEREIDAEFPSSPPIAPPRRLLPVAELARLANERLMQNDLARQRAQLLLVRPGSANNNINAGRFVTTTMSTAQLQVAFIQARWGPPQHIEPRACRHGQVSCTTCAWAYGVDDRASLLSRRT